VVFLQDVLDESINRARDRIDSVGTISSDIQRARVARQIGVGAVVFSEVGGSRKRNITYDVDQALDLSKQSAPSVQYAYARTRAILERAASEGVSIDNQSLGENIAQEREFALIKQIAAYPDAVSEALAAREPSIVAQSILEIAAALNHLHQNDRVFSSVNVSVDDDTRNTRLRLIRAGGQVIKNGLGLLGIEAPEKM
jgi:arginyl-tRNA synthetase